MRGAGNGARARPVEHHPDFLDLLAGDLQGVQQSRPGDNGGAVLIVVEDGNLHGLPERLLDVEALRRLDILQVDSPEGRFQDLAGADNFLGIFRGQLDIENVDIGEALEQHALAFHDRFAGHGADIAQAQNRGAVADHRHQVALSGVFVGQAGIAFDLLARDSHARRISQAEIPLRPAGLCGSH